MPFLSRFPRFFAPLAWGALALFGGPADVAAQPVGDSTVTAALGVGGDPENDVPHRVYLTWWPTGAADWEPGAYAVYRKPGQPDDGGSFTLAGVTQPRTAALGAGQAINQARKIGEKRSELSRNIDGLFDKVVPVSGMKLNQKLASIVEVSEVDAESAENLALLSRRHPAAAIASGVGFVEPIGEGEVRTYEVRSCPGNMSSPSDCDVVVGRVVVEGGQVKRLPAPGPPVHVPFVDEDGDRDPRGNLNAPLRWATPQPLRERSLVRFGYNVYRVDPDLAEDRGWDSNQPDPAVFRDLIRKHPDKIDQVNDRPVITDKTFTRAEAGDLNADPETYFIIDSNKRYEKGHKPFDDGDTFYYITAARDLLGRPGQFSEGTKVTIYFEMPPQAPKGVEVDNHYTYDKASDTQTQVFKVSWEPAETRENGPDIAEYWIYRWKSLEQMHDKQAFPYDPLPSNSLTGGRVATVSAGTTEYVDNVGDHPFISYSEGGDLETPATIQDDEAGKTYWYTVRAVDDSAGSGNISGNSGPAYGVLRDRIGPDAPGGGVTADCVLPPSASLASSSVERPASGSFDSELTYLDFSMKRLASNVEWVEFYVVPLGGERSFMGRYNFSDKQDAIDPSPVQFRNDIFTGGVSKAMVLARVGGPGGKTSDYATGEFTVGLAPGAESEAYVQTFDFQSRVPVEGDCPEHRQQDVGKPATAEINPLDISFSLTAGTREWKLYRRIDDGPRTLLRQGIADANKTPSVTVQDQDLPVNGGRVCYYVQLFDRHGNPSVFKRLECITVKPRVELPKPMLSPVQPVGESPDKGSARLKWFTPPEGVERFEVAIRKADGGVPKTDISDDLRLDLPPEGTDSDPALSVGPAGPDDETYRTYVTGRVGADFDAGPSYSAHWNKNFATGTEYAIRVRARGAGGATGPWSNEQLFIWSKKNDFSDPFDGSDCVVPWPVRGTPDADADFPVKAQSQKHPIGLKAFMNKEYSRGGVAYHGGAVRVGRVKLADVDYSPPDSWDSLPESPPESGLFPLPSGPEPEEGPIDLTGAFYHRANGTPLTDFMLYRYQVPNDAWPEVSGDVYQVTPLIENIAATPSTMQGTDITAVHDPYVFITEIPNTERLYHLYVKDTQPVIEGAKYRYLVVRYDDRGEIAQVIPLSPVTAK